MAINLSTQFENNLRRVSEVGVATLPAKIAVGGDRLGQADEFAKSGEDYQVYTIPADSIAPKIYFIVDEAFDAGATAQVKTIVDGTELVAALDLATVGASVSTVVDTYFSAADGFSIKLNKDVTKGKLRCVAEFISASTNNGIYVDLGA